MSAGPPLAGTHRATNVPPAALGGLAVPATGSIRLAGEHFAAAAVYLLIGSLGLVWIAPQLASATYLSPHVAGLTHFFTLGWLTTTIFGALYQLLPVALGAPIRWPRVGHASFWTFAPGAGLFACGVASSVTALHHAGIALVTTGVVLAIVNIGATLPRARARDVTWAAIALSLTFLASTLVLGVLLLHNLHTGFLGAARVRFLAAHLHIAIAGWAFVMIIGVSHRLLPMFLLAHGADSRWTRRALALLGAGVPLLVLGLLLQWRWAAWTGATLMEAGFACWVRQASRFHRARVRRNIEVGMRFAAGGVGFFVLAAALAPAVLALGSASPRVATAYVTLLLPGGIVLFVAGFFYKIVPLLAWTVHYRGRMGQGAVPTVAQLFSARVAHAQLALMAGGVLLLLAGTLTGFVPAAYAGSIAYAGGAVLFAIQMARIARGGSTIKKPS